MLLLRVGLMRAIAGVVGVGCRDGGLLGHVHLLVLGGGLLENVWLVDMGLLVGRGHIHRWMGLEQPVVGLETDQRLGLRGNNLQPRGHRGDWL